MLLFDTGKLFMLLLFVFFRCSQMWYFMPLQLFVVVQLFQLMSSVETLYAQMLVNNINFSISEFYCLNEHILNNIL